LPHPTTAVYLRSSIAENLNDQLLRCEALAARLGLLVVRRYQDKETPVRADERSGYQEMLEGARRGDFDHLIADDIKCLWRIQSEWKSRPFDLQALNLHLITVSGDDTRVAGWAATIERQVSAERIRKAELQHMVGEVARSIEVMKTKRN
jgi:DNA invertase Pin-like site-specific DNA recombinase